jgi:general secretion pathway protein D
MKKTVAYRRETSDEAVDPDKENRQYKIDVLIRQGIAFYDDGQYDKARDKFEEALVQNPYEMRASDYLRRINLKLIEKGKARFASTLKERIAEVEWKMITPIVPRTLTGQAETLAQPVEKVDAGEGKIFEKLKNIIIDRIEFEEVSLPTVIKYLRKRCKELDPEKTGINIFLRLSAKAELASLKDNAGAEGGGGEKKKKEGEEEVTDENAPVEGGGGGGGGVEKTVNMAADNIPIGDALEYICKTLNLKRRVEKYAVVIASPDVPLEEVETVVIPVDQEAVELFKNNAGAAAGAANAAAASDVTNVKALFERRGVEFPPGADIVFDTRISRLIATNTPENLKQIRNIIHSQFNTIDPQVLIQAKFVEIAQNDLQELGFEYYISRSNANMTPLLQSTLTAIPNEGTTLGYPVNLYNDHGVFQGTVPAGTLITQSDASYYHSALSNSASTWRVNDNVLRNVKTSGLGNGVAPGRPDEVINYTAWSTNGIKYQAIVHALDQSDTANVLSTPRVTTMKGQEATIRMVTEYYYPSEWSEPTIGSSSNNNSVTNVFVGSIPTFGEAREEGIILRVTPNVDADNYTITLEMRPVVQQRVGWTDYSYDVSVNNSTYSNRIIMPIIEARTVETSVIIYDGETIVLGGVISDQVDSIDDKIPFLGDIPLFGRLFQSKATSSAKKNLLVFLTCRLVNPDGSPIRERELRGLPAFRQ